MKPSTLRVAILDDEESVLRALQRLLRSAGMEVVTYESGIEFLSVVTQAAPDCVVLDLHMPGFSGFDVMELLPPEYPVIAITGHDSPETQARAHRATAYLRKPIDDQSLLAAIAHATSIHP